LLVVGNYLSPYVRKVLACLELKGVAYEVDPLTPFFGDDEFERLSPLRRIPVLIDGEVSLCDSSVICAYLDERFPDRPLLPPGVADRARARWLEEFADSRLGDVLIWRMVYPLLIGPTVFGEARDPELAARNQAEDVPQVLDYLEGQLPADGWLFDDIGLADVAIAAFFRSAEMVRFRIDAERWPRAAGFVARVLDHPALAALRPFENLSRKTPIPEQRAALKAAGAPISARSFATDAPRRGTPRL
jgi:glutathione S-transferase